MNPLVLRFRLALLAFLLWLSYLLALVWTRPLTPTGSPLVLSRPQLLASTVDVIADIEDPHQPITVVEVLYGPDNGGPKVGDRLQVDNLLDARPLPRRRGEQPPADYLGPGRYLVPLQPTGEKGRFDVAAVPPSPGFFENLVRIYPDLPQTRAQYRQIHKPAP
jgi:hypothetical protein